MLPPLQHYQNKLVLHTIEPKNGTVPNKKKIA